MNEKWCQHDIGVVVIRELHSNWKGVVVTELQWVAFLATHAICSITLMGVKIQWVTNGATQKLGCKPNYKIPIFS
jgi:hypothetical protein